MGDISKKVEKPRLDVDARSKHSTTASSLITKLVTCQKKLKASQRIIAALKKEQERDFQRLISQLLVLEGQLRAEQRELISLLTLKEKTISNQQAEIVKLKINNNHLLKRLKKYTELLKDNNLLTEAQLCKVSLGEEDSVPSLSSYPSNTNDASYLVEIITESKYNDTDETKRNLIQFLNDMHEKGTDYQWVLAQLKKCLTEFIEDSENPKPCSHELLSKIHKLCDTSDMQLPDTNAISGASINNKECAIQDEHCSAQLAESSEVLQDIGECDYDSGTVADVDTTISSPESTLVKPVTPRVVRLARHFEGICAGGSHQNFSVDQLPDSVNYHSAFRSVILDEHEVTSGYNSDSVSEHDYENMQVKTILNVASTKESQASMALPSHKNSDQLKNECQDWNGMCSTLNLPRSRYNISLLMEPQGDHMTDNFEEFTLDSLELGQEEDSLSREKDNFPFMEPRRSGDGAEGQNGMMLPDSCIEAMPLLSNENSPGVYASIGNMNSSDQYEKFLEVTGLSQKSILTPTRMFSNHRSVVKPRDIKHRDKMRIAVTTSSGSDDMARCWLQPYI